MEQLPPFNQYRKIRRVGINTGSLAEPGIISGMLSIYGIGSQTDMKLFSVTAQERPAVKPFLGQISFWMSSHIFQYLLILFLTAGFSDGDLLTHSSIRGLKYIFFFSGRGFYFRSIPW